MQTEYEKIADLLFPKVTKTREYYENLYPNRVLQPGAMVTRFAPSPTGYLHLGNFFSALVSYACAKSTNGVFFFRLEDTDQKREKKDAQKVALETLLKFGINHSEGLMFDGTQEGSYGPYVQSERVEIYKTYAKDLVAKGRAFPCFCEKTNGKEDVEQNRVEQLEEMNDLVDHDVCRDLTFEEVSNNLKQGKTFAIKLRSTGEFGVKIETNDVILGHRQVNSNCKDVVILKSNFIPPYAFAHAIDDHLMKTTLVVRGSDWYSSISSHMDIFKALDFSPMLYCHVPLLCKIADNGNKRKLSKRYDPEADMRFYIKQGYPRESVLEYLFTLANSNFEEWRIANHFEDIFKFNFTTEKISATYPLVDMNKFNDISKNVISKFTAETVYDNVLAWAEEFDNDWFNLLNEFKDFAILMFSIDRTEKNPRKDIIKWEDTKHLYSYFYKSLFQPTSIESYEIDETISKQSVDDIFTSYLKNYNEQDDKQTWFDKIKDFCESVGFCKDVKQYKQNPNNYKGHCGTVCTIIRIVLTGRKNTPDLYSICKLLGLDEMKRRLNLFLSMMK